MSIEEILQGNQLPLWLTMIDISVLGLRSGSELAGQLGHNLDIVCTISLTHHPAQGASGRKLPHLMSRPVMSQARTPLLSAQVGHSDHTSQINKAHKDWENPQVYQRNRLGSHVPLLSHTKQSQALSRFSDDAQQSAWSNVILLSGTEWRFNLFEMPESVTPDFHAPSFDSSQWSKVRSGRYASPGAGFIRSLILDK